MTIVADKTFVSPIEALLASLGAASLTADQMRELEEVADQCPTRTSLDKEPIRTIHHLSCTGGTLFAKCIASMPNVVVLNEIHPFSKMQIPKGKPPFTPTDIVALVRQGDRHLASYDVIKDVFVSDLALLRKRCWETGRVLVLRDHSHSQFLFGELNENMPTLRDVVAERFPVLSVVTTRKPEDAFASMERQGWHRHFEPSTLTEYKRRQAAFRKMFPQVDSCAYEDFTANPREKMAALCASLNIQFNPNFEKHFSAFRFSGDSGRSGDHIIRSRT
jgi:hypothetical protein